MCVIKTSEREYGLMVDRATDRFKDSAGVNWRSCRQGGKEKIHKEKNDGPTHRVSGSDRALLQRFFPSPSCKAI